MYHMKNCVTYSQVKDNLRTDMVSIAHYFQDCTIFHSESIGKGLKEIKESHKAWFLSSWQIEVERYPEFGEEITVRTWPYEFKGFYGYRNFDILDKNGKRIVWANSIWILMDVEKMMITKALDEDLKGYDLSPALDMDYASRKIKVFGEEFKIEDPYNQEAILVKPSFLDSNHHVNNARYVMEAMDFIKSEKEIKEMRVDYRKAALLGDKMYPVLYKKDEYTQVVFEDEKRNPFVIIEVI